MRTNIESEASESKNSSHPLGIKLRVATSREVVSPGINSQGITKLRSGSTGRMFFRDFADLRSMTGACTPSACHRRQRVVGCRPRK